MRTPASILFFCAILTLAAACGSVEETRKNAGSVFAHELLSWQTLGHGTVHHVDMQTIRMAEDPGSAGLMLVSPKDYNNVTLRYEVKPQNPESVLVAILSLSDRGESTTVTFPPGYDGGNPWLQANREYYFFAFHNAAHNATPFLRRFTRGSEEAEPLATNLTDPLKPGEWSRIEVGRKGAHLWLKVDGKMILDATDPDPLDPGHLALRLRGTTKSTAECLIRNVVIK